MDVKRLATCFAVLIILVPIFLSGQATAAPSQDQSTQSLYAIDGVQATSCEGSVLATGSLQEAEDGSLICIMPEVWIGADVGADVSESSLSAYIDSNCNIIMGSVDVISTSSNSAMFANTRYQGGAWSEHKDVAGLVLTETYAHMYYWANGSQAWGGSGAAHSCAQKRDGWYLNWGSWNWNPSGGSSVYIYSICEFSWIGGSYNHTHQGTFYGYGSGGWNYGCSHSGATVPGGYYNCGGKRWVV